MNGDEDGRLQSLIDHVERQLQVASQGSSLCALSRSGQPVDAVKYYEGGWAALTHVRRERGDGPLADALADVSGQWRERLAAQREAGGHRTWIAYYSGGVEFLEQFAQALEP